MSGVGAVRRLYIERVNYTEKIRTYKIKNPAPFSALLCFLW